MIEFRCQSGPLRITVIAETAHQAAMEAIAWWGPRSKRYRYAKPGTDRLGNEHRRSLDAVLTVSEVDADHGGIERFSTFELIAESEGRIASDAWNDLLDRIAGNN